MCVIFFYVNSNPQKGGYKLILASNRDEFYARDTKEACKWADVENCYGGIDMEPGREGGTWLAISGQDGIFKIAALLNLTGEPRPRNAVGKLECLVIWKICIKTNNKITHLEEVSRTIYLILKIVWPFWKVSLYL